MGNITITINGTKVQAEKNSTLLEVIRFLGIDVPTLCHNDGLSPYGACRLCTVEVEEHGRTRFVESCLYPVKDGIAVKTHTEKLVQGRKILMELLLARCPNSKTLQDLASKFAIEKIRFKIRKESCVLCGLCVRMCNEQMMSGAIGFINRGAKREVVTPFRMKSDLCRNCGACMYICPAVELQCRGHTPKGELCNSCLRFNPVCLDRYDQVMCYLKSCGSCIERGEKNELL